MHWPLRLAVQIHQVITQRYQHHQTGCGCTKFKRELQIHRALKMAPKLPAHHQKASLMAGSDCNTCHRPDMKLVGPSFKEIANKYTAADVDKLADKVIKGGSGSWGEVCHDCRTRLK
jgi:cytochrome c551/c552